MPQYFADLIHIINELAPCISLVAVGLVTYYFERKDKKNKKIRELEKKNLSLEAEQRRKERKSERDRLNARIEELTNNHNKILESVQVTQEGLEKVIQITLEDRTMIKSLATKVDSDKRSIADIDKRLDTVVSMIEKQSEDIQKLSINLHNYTLYSQALARVVTALAETLKNNHMDGDLSNVVSDFKKTEYDMFTSISEGSIIKGPKRRKGQQSD